MNMPSNSKTTKHTAYTPLVDAVNSSAGTEVMKGIHSSTPDGRPTQLYSGTEDQANRLKMAIRKKNGNLPSLSYQQRNRISGSVQNLPKCKDQVDDLVQLESKLNHLVMGVKSNLNPIGPNFQIWD